jgi:diamine N-acetyltransferase
LNKEAPKIRYICGDEKTLEDTAVLWAKLNEHHLYVSKDFKQYYQQMTFHKRKAVLLEKAKDGKLRVDIALDNVSGQKVGYCVSSVNRFNEGEIESIFVDTPFRRFGIGDALLRKALAWMDAQSTESKIIEVGVGNEQAFSFYARYGFLPRKTVLKQVKNSE